MTGISIAAQPELNVPTTPIEACVLGVGVERSPLHLSASHFPAWAVESSHAWKAMFLSPAFQFCLSSRYLIAPHHLQRLRA